MSQGLKTTESETMSSILEKRWRLFPFLCELQTVPGEYPLFAIYVGMVIEGIQLLSLALMPDHNWGPGMRGMTYILNSTHIPLYGFFNAGIYACLAVTLLVLLLYILHVIFFIYKTFTMKNYVPGSMVLESRLFVYARFFSYFMSSVGFIPVTQNFLALAFRNNSTGDLTWFPGHKNNGPIGIIGLIACILGIAFHFIETYAMSIFLANTNLNSDHPARRCNTKLDGYYLIYRFVACVLFQYFFTIDNLMLYDVYMVIVSFLMMSMYQLMLPYYSESTNRLRGTFLTLATLYSILSAISTNDKVGDFFRTSKVNLDLIIFWVLLPSVSYLTYTYYSVVRVSPIYKQAYQGLVNGQLTNPIVHLPKSLPQGSEDYQMYAILLDRLASGAYERVDKKTNARTNAFGGALEDDAVAHYDFGTGISAGSPAMNELVNQRFVLSRFIAPYIDLIMFATDAELANRFILQYCDLTKQPASGYQLRYAVTIYIKAMSKYPNDAGIRLACALLLYHKAEDVQMARMFVKELRRREGSLATSFMAWKLEARINHALNLTQGSQIAALRQAKACHRETLHITTEFWFLLMNRNRTVSELAGCNRALVTSLMDSKTRYESLLATDVTNLESLSCYAVFCDHVLDQKEVVSQCLQCITHMVDTRDQTRSRGVKMKAAANASLTKLKLSLQATKDSTEAFMRGSRVLFLRPTTITICVLTFLLLLATIIVLSIKQSHVGQSEESMYYVGMMRTLGSQISILAKQMIINKDNGVQTPPDVIASLNSLRLDYMALYNGLMFGQNTRGAKDILLFYRNLNVRQLAPGLTLGLWTYLGVVVSALQDLISRQDQSDYIEWIAGDFNHESTLSMTQLFDEYAHQHEKDLRVLTYACMPMLAAAVALQVIGALVLFNGMYRVQGARILTFALLRLIPLREIRSIYRRATKHNASLDAFFALSTRLKVAGLVRAQDEIHIDEDNSERTNEHLDLLDHVMASPDGGNNNNAGMSLTSPAMSSAPSDLMRAAAASNDGGTVFLKSPGRDRRAVSGSDSDSEEDVDDWYGTNSDSGDSGGMMKGSTSRSFGVGADDSNSKKSKKKKKSARHRRSNQERRLLEGVATEQSYLINLDRNTNDAAYQPAAIALYVIIMLLVIGVVIVNVLGIGYPRKTEDYYDNVVSHNRVLKSVKVDAVFAVLNTGLFSVRGDQRYYSDFIVMRGSGGWDKLRAIQAESFTSKTAAETFFEVQDMYQGLLQILDICLRLMCTTYEANCQTNRLTYAETYISKYEWGPESSLIIAELAAKTGLYTDSFGLLEGSDDDLQKTPADQLKLAYSVLTHPLFNDFVEVLFAKLDVLQENFQDPNNGDVLNLSISSAAISGGAILFMIAFSFFVHRRSRVMTTWGVIGWRVLAFLCLASIVVLSVINASSTKDVKIAVYMVESAQITSKWTVALFKSFWYPTMYLLDPENMLWNYFFHALRRDYKNSHLLTDLGQVGGVSFAGGDTQSMSAAQSLGMIGVTLIYEATKALPDVLPYSEIFDAEYLDNMTWDFKAEPDYYTVLATYSDVDSNFYSTRAQDLALPDADKLTLASHTIVSHREDSSIEVLFGYVLTSDSLVSIRFESDRSIFSRQVNIFTANIILSGVTALVLVIMFSHAYVNYTMKLVNVVPVSTGQSAEAASSSKVVEDAAPMGAVAAKSSAPKADHKSHHNHHGPGSPNSVTDKNLGGSNGEKSFAEVSTSKLNMSSPNLADKSKSKSISETAPKSTVNSVETVTTKEESVRKRVLPFFAFAILGGLTIATMIYMGFTANWLKENKATLDSSSQRGWVVSQSVYVGMNVQMDAANFATTREQIAALYQQHNEILVKLYFKDSMDPKDFGLLISDKTQDDLLFARNKYYDMQEYLGPPSTDTDLYGFQILSTLSGEENSTDDIETSQFFCNHDQEESIMKVLSRGVGLVYDGVWASHLRALQSTDVAGYLDVLEDMQSSFKVLLNGLGQSDYQYFEFLKSERKRYFAVPIILLSVAVGFLVVAVIWIFLPFTHHLVEEDTFSRILIMAVPPDVRVRYPALGEFVSKQSKAASGDRVQAAVQDMARGAVVATDAIGNIIRYNELAEQLFGYSAAEVIGRKVNILMPDEVAAEHDAHILAFDESNARLMGRVREVRAKCKDGRLISVSIRLTTVKLSNQSERVFIGFFEEVADRAKLVLQEKINEATMQLNPDGIVMINKNGIIVRTNRGLSQIFGYEEEELLEKNISALMPEEVGRHHDSYLAAYAETGAKRRIDNTVVSIARRKDGTTFRASIHVTELQSSDQVYFLGYIEDLSRTHHLETAKSLHDTVLNLSPGPVVVVDYSGQVLQMSKSALEVFQYRKDEVDEGSVKVTSLVPKKLGNGSYFETRIGNNRPAVNGLQAPISTYNAVARRKDNTTFPASLTVCELFIAGGGLHTRRTFIGFFTDKTKAEALEDTGKLIHTLVGASVCPIVVLTARGEVASCNDAAGETFGYNPSELIGEHYRILGNDQQGTNPADVARQSNNHTPSIASPRKEEEPKPADPTDIFTTSLDTSPWLGDYAVTRDKSIFGTRRTVLAKRKNGDLFPMELRLAEMPPIHGAEATVVAYMRDLSNDHKTVQTFYMNETVEELSPYGILVVDGRGKIEQMSPAAEECFGFHSTELLGVSVDVLLPELRGTNSSVDGSHAKRSFSVISDANASRTTTVSERNQERVMYALAGMVGQPRSLSGHRSDGRTFMLNILVEELSTEMQRGQATYVLYCDDTSSLEDVNKSIEFSRRIRAHFDVAMLHLDESGTVIMVNDACSKEMRAEMTVSGDNPLIGRNFKDMFVTDSAAQYYMHNISKRVNEHQADRTVDAHTVAGKKKRDGSTVVIRGGRHVLMRRCDNSELSVSCRLVSVRTHHSKCLTFIAYLSNREDQSDGQLADRFNSTVISLSPVPLIIADHRGFITKVSPSAAEMFGYSSPDALVDESVKILMTDAIAATHDANISRYHLTGISNIVGRATKQTGKRRDGTLFPVELTISAVAASPTTGADGTTQVDPANTIFVASIRSLDEDVFSERIVEAVRSMLEQHTSPMVVSNWQGVIEEVNTAFCNEYDYEPEDLVGQDVSVFMTPEDAQYHRRHIANYFRTRMRFAIDNVTVRHVRRKGGEVVPVRTLIKEVAPETGDPSGTRFIAYLTPDSMLPPALLQQVGVTPGTSVSTRSSRMKPTDSAFLSQQSVSASSGARIHMDVDTEGNRVRRLEDWLTDEAGISFAVLNNRGLVMRLSSAASRTFACTMDDVKGALLSSIVARDSHAIKMEAEFSEIIKRMSSAQDDVVVKRTLQLQKRSGEMFPVEMTWKRILDEAGVWQSPVAPTSLMAPRPASARGAGAAADKPKRYVFVVNMENLTNQVEPLRWKQLCDAAMDVCNIPTILMDTTGIVQVFNPAAVACFGWSKEEVVGRNVAMLMPTKTADMHDRFLSVYAESGEQHMIGKSRDITAKRRDGSYFPAELTVREVNEADSARFFIGHIVDRTVPMRDELLSVLNKSILDKSEHAIVVLDMDDNVIRVSQAALQLFGFGSFEELTTASAFTTSLLFTPSSAKQYKSLMHQAQDRHEKELMFNTPSSGRPAVDENDILISTVMDMQRNRPPEYALLLSATTKFTMPGAQMRHRDGSSLSLGIEGHAVFHGKACIGGMLRFSNFHSESDIMGVKEETALITEGTILNYKRPLFILSRSGRFVRVNKKLAALLGYDSIVDAESNLLGNIISSVITEIELPDQTVPGSPMSMNTVSSPTRSTGQLQHEQMCMNVLDSYVTSGAVGSGSMKQHRVVEAVRKDGTTVELFLLGFTILGDGSAPATHSLTGNSSDMSASGTNAPQHAGSSGTTTVADLHYYAVEVEEVASTRHAAALQKLPAALVKLCPSPMVVISAKTQLITDANDALLTTFDFSLDQLVGKPIFILLGQRESREGELHDFLENLQSGNNSTATTAELHNARVSGETKTGRALPFELSMREATMNGESSFLCVFRQV